MKRAILTRAVDRAQPRLTELPLRLGHHGLPAPECKMQPGDPTERWRDYVATRMGCLRGGPVTVEPVARRIHPHSTMWEFQISWGNGRSQAVLLKAPSPSPQPPTCATTTSGARPRLFEPLDPRMRAQSEYAALVNIDAHFRQLDDPRFGTVRPLDFAIGSGAILMEKISAPSLKTILAHTHRWRRSPNRPILTQAFRNSGAWLRFFHQSPLPSNAQPQHIGDHPLAQSIRRMSEYLSEISGERTFFRRLASKADAAAERRLTAAPPAGLAHCDYAPRNILVGPAAQISVIDTAARWQAPVYMDIAYFLVNLKATQTQIYSWGWMTSKRALATYEHAFLSGYFGTQIPWQLLRLYELQSLIDRWAAITERLLRQASSGQRHQRAAARAKLWMSGQYFRSRTADLLHTLGES